MLGKSWMKEQPDEAIAWFKKARELKADGCTDNLGLAAASLGWQARIELDRKNITAAIDLYLSQMATGDPTAQNSLRDVAAILLKENKPDVLLEMARHPAARRVITSALVAEGGHNYSQEQNFGAPRVLAWLNAIERAQIGKVEDADRLSWAAYQAGAFDLAQRWSERADPDSPITLWIQAKLSLRKGRTTEGVALLAKAARKFPADDNWNALMLNGADGDYEEGYKPARRVLGELGALQFARNQYTQALDCLLRADYWTDAAYVAERVLTVDELKTYVDSNWSEESIALKSKAGRYADWHNCSPAALRQLLARRLTRLGRWREARTYFPKELQSTLDAYVQGIRQGHDSKRSADERAQGFWEAAKIGCKDGMELLGSELGPDDGKTGGAFDRGSSQVTVSPSPSVAATLFSVTAGLRKRLEQNVVTPDKRFHYRYIAADHAWAAAELMPDNSDEKAAVLNTAGQWLASRDPQAADRFYKALVRRCGNTQLGREAARLKWFPKSAEMTNQAGAPTKDCAATAP
jgi:hypothetical protein